jgi:hypothetical protein
MEGLAAAIIARAVFDWIYEPRGAKGYAEQLDGAMATLEEESPAAFRTMVQACDGDVVFGSIRGELLSFWWSEWGNYLRDYFGLDWLDIRHVTE